MFATALVNGLVQYSDSPLLRAIKLGRVIVVDEADKAPEHVVAIFRSLAGKNEMTLSDGRRVCPTGRGREGDIIVHPGRPSMLDLTTYLDSCANSRFQTNSARKQTRIP
jgi:von Willebrand factor A domain-containing protein 8